MEKFALLARLEAKPGKENEVLREFFVHHPNSNIQA